MTTNNKVPYEKQDAGKSHVRFDEVEVASAEPRRGSLLYKRLVTIIIAALAALGVFGAEKVSVGRVANHYPWDGKVDCTYTLSGLQSGYLYKGIFTLSVEKNGAIVSRAVTNGLASADGTYTATFDCTDIFGEGLYPNGGLSVDLVREQALLSDASGSPIGITGDVLVIDISGGPADESYPTAEYSDVDIGTFNCDVYKTTKIVLRKIPAGTYCCQPGTAGSVSQRLATGGFYIGVFPVTQRQYELVMDSTPSWWDEFKLDEDAGMYPVECVTWNSIRGGLDASVDITASSPDGFIRRIVAKTGLSGFDLPTEAQWEMASRADYSSAYGAYWNGTEQVGLTDNNIDMAAWSGNNSDNRTHQVGGKKPNPWGLYDMLGNVSEWCRDDSKNVYDSSYVDEPYADAGASYQIIRGGDWNDRKQNCRPSFRYQTPGGPMGFLRKQTSSDIGFRLQRMVR